MNHQGKRGRLDTNCPRTRLAEGDIGSVDVCACGMWQLHIGAVTLRFAPAAVSELLSLLGQAVAEHSAQRLADAESAIEQSFMGKRGEA
jgi:hypothetical protein